MARKSTKQERPGIEYVGSNTFRVGFLPTITDENGNKVRRWVRKTFTYPDTLTHEQQLDLAEADLALLRSRHTQQVMHVDVDDLPSADQLTIAQLCQLWIDTKLPTESADYAKTASSLIELHIVPHLGSVIVSKLTPLRINAWVALLLRKPKRNKPKETLSARSVRHIYITLATIYNWARENQVLHETPFAATHAPKVRKHKPKYLDDDQAVGLLRQLATEENMAFRCAVMLALCCGLRLGEVGALTWSDVHWRDHAIDITKAVKQTPADGRQVGTTKTDDSIRMITVPAALMTLLDETRKYQEDNRRILGSRWRGEGLIVCNFDGSPQNKDTPSRQWKRFAEAHGYEGVTFHNLRTSHATILMSNNIDAVAVASRMGHSDAVTTLKFYAMMVAKRDRDSANVMDKIARRADRQGSLVSLSISSSEISSHAGATVLSIVLNR